MPILIIPGSRDNDPSSCSLSIPALGFDLAIAEAWVFSPLSLRFSGRSRALGVRLAGRGCPVRRKLPWPHHLYHDEDEKNEDMEQETDYGINLKVVFHVNFLISREAKLSQPMPS